MRIIFVMGMPRSFKIQPNSFACGDGRAPLSSVLGSATVGCFLLLHDMAPILSEKMNPDVDHLLAL